MNDAEGLSRSAAWNALGVPGGLGSRTGPTGPLAPCGKLRGSGGRAPGAGQADRGTSQRRSEKKQLIDRLPPGFVRKTLEDFNNELLGASDAARALGIGRSRLYGLRAAWLRDRDGFAPTRSGGNRNQPWPSEVLDFLTEFLPLQSPPNYQLVADEMERLLDFKRARSTVEAYVKGHLAHLVPQPVRKLRTYIYRCLVTVRPEFHLR